MPAPVIAQYGDLNLQMGELTHFQQAIVNDASGVRPLYLQTIAGVSFIVNPVVTQPPGAPLVGEVGGRRPGEIVGRGFHPAQAFREIAEYLYTPRRLLSIRMGSQVVLESPQRTADGLRMDRDANNGPMCVRVSCDGVMGDRTLFCTAIFQTWTNPCTGSTAVPPPTLIANQFQTSTDLQWPEYLEVRTTTGTATFRTDFLSLRGTRAGLLRPLNPADFIRSGWIMPPVPPNYVREIVSVTATADGTAVNYTVRDHEVHGSWGLRGAGPITRCEGRMRKHWDVADVFTSALTRYLQVGVWGGPFTTSATLITALAVVMQTIRLGTGEQLFRHDAVRGDRRALARKLFSSATVEVEFPRRHASAVIETRIPALIARPLGFWGMAEELDDPRFWPEDFGNRLGSRDLGRVAQPGPRFSGTTGTGFVGLVARLLEPACQTPEQPTVPPANRGDFP